MMSAAEQKSAADQKGRRTRKKHSNSHFGCKTCKKRKVKCDEKLPICSNCLRMNLECPYLTLDETTLNKMKAFHQKLAQENSTSNVSAVAPGVAASSGSAPASSASSTSAASSAIVRNSTVSSAGTSPYPGSTTNDSSPSTDSPQSFTTISESSNPGSSFSGSTNSPTSKPPFSPMAKRFIGSPLNSRTKQINIKVRVYQKETESLKKLCSVVSSETKILNESLDFLSFKNLSYAARLFNRKVICFVYFNRVLYNTVIYFSLSFISYIGPIQGLIITKNRDSNLSKMNNRLKRRKEQILGKLTTWKLESFQILLLATRRVLARHKSLSTIQIESLIWSTLHLTFSLQYQELNLKGYSLFISGLFAITIADITKSIEDDHSASSTIKIHSAAIAATSSVNSLKTSLFPPYNPDFLFEILEKLDIFENNYKPLVETDLSLVNKLKLLKNFSSLLSQDLLDSKLSDSIFCYDSKFMLKVFHNFYSIIPHNLTHLGIYKSSSLSNQIDVVIGLFHLTLANSLLAIMPHIMLITFHEFLGSQRSAIFEVTFSDYLVNEVLPIITDPILYNLAKYLIRIMSFFQMRLLILFDSLSINNPIYEYKSLDPEAPDFDAIQYVTEFRKNYQFIETQIVSFDTQLIVTENYPTLPNSVSYTLLYYPQQLPAIQAQAGQIAATIMQAFPKPSNATSSSTEPLNSTSADSRSGSHHSSLSADLDPSYQSSHHQSATSTSDPMLEEIIDFNVNLGYNPDAPLSSDEMMLNDYQLYNADLMAHDLMDHGLTFDSFSNFSFPNPVSLGPEQYGNKEDVFGFSMITKNSQLGEDGLFIDADINSYKILEKHTKIFKAGGELQQMDFITVKYPNLLNNLFLFRKKILDSCL